jgi:hypothetical protein
MRRDAYGRRWAPDDVERSAVVRRAALAAAMLAVAVLLVTAAPFGGAPEWFSFLGPVWAGGHHGHQEADGAEDSGATRSAERRGIASDNGSDVSGDRTDWSGAESSGSGPTGTAVPPVVERSEGRAGLRCTREVGSESGLHTALSGAEPGDVICMRAGSGGDPPGLEGWTPDAPAEAAAPKRIVVQLIG